MSEPSAPSSILEFQYARFEYMTRTGDRAEEPATTTDDYLSFNRLVKQALARPGCIGLRFWPEIMRFKGTERHEDDYRRAIYFGKRLVYRQNMTSYHGQAQFLAIQRLWREHRLDLVVCSDSPSHVELLQTGDLVVSLDADGDPVEEHIVEAWNRVHLNYPPRAI